MLYRAMRGATKDAPYLLHAHSSASSNLVLRDDGRQSSLINRAHMVDNGHWLQCYKLNAGIYMRELDKLVSQLSIESHCSSCI